jgi:hypothetical protein
LEAEALALLLVARVENLLQLRRATFLMDNLSLARIAATKSATDPQVLREIRQQIAQFKQVSQELTPKV